MTLDFTSLTMVKVVGKFNGVAVPVQPIREGDAEFGSTLYAKILNMSGDSKVTPPKEGTKGVVIQRNKDDQQQVFWLGALVTSAADEQEKAAILSKDNASVSVHENGFNVSHSGGSIDQTNGQTKITTGTNSILLTDSNAAITISKDNKAGSYITLSPKQNALYSDGSTNIRSINDIEIQSLKGSVEFYGAKKENSDDYLPIRMFSVNSRASEFKTNGGPIFVEGGKMIINLTDSRTTHTIPGLGGPTAFELSVLSGDIDVSTQAGDINIKNMNSTSIGKISIVNGSILSPTTIMETAINMTVTEIDICQSTIPFAIEAYLNLSNASAELYATRGVEVNSDVNIDISAKACIDIDSKIKAAVTSAKIEIISQVQTIIKSAMVQLKADKMDVQTSMADINMKIANLSGQVLNLEGSKMIKMGPKAVAPTGAGPFCAIPVCTWNGAPHVGDVAIG